MRTLARRMFPLPMRRPLRAWLFLPALLLVSLVAPADTARIGQLLRYSEQLAGAGRFQPAHAPLDSALRLAQATHRDEVIGRVLFAHKE